MQRLNEAELHESALIHLVFGYVDSQSRGSFGPNRPIIGAVLDEAAAVAADLVEHPGEGISWETFEVFGVADLSKLEYVWIAIDMDTLASDPIGDPEPLMAFGSKVNGQDWVCRQAKAGRNRALWRIPIGEIDVSCPEWPDDSPECAP